MLKFGYNTLQNFNNMILRELLLKFVMDISWCSRQVRYHGSALNKFVDVDTTFWYGRYF